MQPLQLEVMIATTKVIVHNEIVFLLLHSAHNTTCSLQNEIYNCSILKTTNFPSSKAILRTIMLHLLDLSVDWGTTTIMLHLLDHSVEVMLGAQSYDLHRAHLLHLAIG